MSKIDHRTDVLTRFKPFFEPKSVAVVGASATDTKSGNLFIQTLRANGYAGSIYPIHARATEIEGLPAYKRMADVPTNVDYAFVAVRAANVVPFLAEAKGHLRYAQVMSSGFGETPHGEELERDLVRTANDGGIRIVGPNCMGLHSPRGRIALVDGAMGAPGGIAFLSQSGGLSLDVVRRGKVLGIDFSAVVSLGNCADVGPNDLLEFMLADPETRVIGLYLESVRDGRRFFEQLTSASARKPIIVLKGGQTQQGQRAAASHTGSLADDARLWDAAMRQTGVIAVRDLDDLMDHFVAFQNPSFDPDQSCQRAVLFGNGGGTSVIATDQFSKAGVDIPPLDGAALRELESLQMPDGASVINPIDVPANILMRDGGSKALRIIDTVRSKVQDAATVLHLNLPVIGNYKQPDVVERLIETIVENEKDTENTSPIHFVLRSDGALETEELKTNFRNVAMRAGIPVYDDLKNSARVLSSLSQLALFRARRANGGDV